MGWEEGGGEVVEVVARGGVSRLPRRLRKTNIRSKGLAREREEREKERETRATAAGVYASDWKSKGGREVGERRGKGAWMWRGGAAEAVRRFFIFYFSPFFWLRGGGAGRGGALGRRRGGEGGERTERERGGGWDGGVWEDTCSWLACIHSFLRA